VLLGANPGTTRARSNSAKRPKFDKPTNPSLHFGNLPKNFFDLDLKKFIECKGFKVLAAKVVEDAQTKKSL